MCGGGGITKWVTPLGMAAVAPEALAFEGVGAGAGATALEEGAAAAVNTAALEGGAQAAVSAAGASSAGSGVVGDLLTSAATGVGSSLVQAALTPKMPAMAMPDAAGPVTQASPQAAAAPNPAAIRQGTSDANAGQGQSSTLLAGLTGVTNDKYNLGRNTLLGA